MATVTHEQVATPAQGRGEIESRYTATRSPPFISVAAHDNRGPIELLKHPRSHNSHDAYMPGYLTLNDNEVRGRIKFCPNCTDDFLRNAALDLLAFTVAHIKFLGQRQGSGQVLSHQKLQRLLGSFEPACRIKPWTELKTDLVAADR